MSDPRVALVTASTRGIGFAIAQTLAQSGYKVLISSRREKNVQLALDKLNSEGLSVEGTVCNVGEDSKRVDLVKYAMNRFNRIDVLVNNAAVNPYYGPILDTSLPAWDKIMAVNVRAAYHLSSLVGKHMIERGEGGSIVNISSIAARKPLEGLGAYCVSKAAVDGLTRSCALELAKYKIRVNAVSPGVIETEFSKSLWEEGSTSSTLLAQTPLGRFGLPSEVARTVKFLCSDESSFITGESILVTGGLGRL